MDSDEDDAFLPGLHVRNKRDLRWHPDCRKVMDAWGEESMETCTFLSRLRKVVDKKRTLSESAIKDLNKPSHVPIPYGKAPYRSRKAKKILQQNQSVRPVPRGTWIPGVNDDDVPQPTHYMPSETPPSTLRQHQRRVFSASAGPSSKSLCASFNTRFMLPGNLSTSDSSSEEPVRTRDDSDLSVKHLKNTSIRKTKSMHAGYSQIIQVNECKETRFSTLPRKIEKVRSNTTQNPEETVRQRLPVFDLDELETSGNTYQLSGLPGMCESRQRRLSKNSNNCTCCSICEMMSPRASEVNLNNLDSNCSCEHCVHNLKKKSGIVQYKHGNVIKTFDWLKQYAKETAL